MRLNVATQADFAAIEAVMPLEDRLHERTVYRRLAATRDNHKGRPAVSFQLKSGPKDKASTLTWSELTDQVTRAANLFRSLGVGEDDVVAYMLPSIPETLVCMLGGMTAGIVHPINPLLEVSQIAALLRESGARVLVTLKPFPKTDVAQKAAAAVALAPDVRTVIEVDLLPHLSPPLNLIVPLIRPKNPVTHSAAVLDLRKALSAANGQSLDFAESDEDRYCAYFHTGGTTGSPKIVRHRHSGILYNGWLAASILFVPEDIVLCPLPLFHVFAVYPIWMGCMTAGSHFVLPTPQGYRGDGVLDNIWKLCERWKTTFMVIVPTAAAAILQRPVDAEMSTVELALCGSASLPRETFRRFESETGIRILEGYGLTEATCLVSVNPTDGDRRIGSVGLSFPFVETRIFRFDANDDVISECATGDVGEICVACPGVNVGETYTDPERNRNLYAHDRYLRTGDLGRLDEDGYLWITGREKDQINRGGHNIDPALIEEAFASHPEVAFTGAIGQPDAKAGELPCAYVELVMGGTATASDLMAHAREHVSERAAVPVHVEVVDELPKTLVGKVFKPALREAAIRRVYGEALSEAGLGAEVTEVIDDRTRGHVVVLSGADKLKDEAIDAVLGGFPRPWDRASPAGNE
ncbi:MAG: acyl-CoA synthetase [Paracoccaceae bacterium]|nr:acyl-CoA synthetase [Paracoccaceae bacterium]